MEDYGSILWLLLAVGAFIYSSGSKTRKKAQEAAKRVLKELEENANRQEAWPSWDVPQNPTKQAESVEIPEAVSLESIDPEIPEAATGTFTGYAPSATIMQSGFESPRKASSHEPVLRAETAKPVTVAATLAAATSDPIGELKHEIKKHFDLRRAVIYSEILKPKFTDHD